MHSTARLVAKHEHDYWERTCQNGDVPLSRAASEQTSPTTSGITNTRIASTSTTASEHSHLKLPAFREALQTLSPSSLILGVDGEIAGIVHC